MVEIGFGIMITKIWVCDRKIWFLQGRRIQSKKKINFNLELIEVAAMRSGWPQGGVFLLFQGQMFRFGLDELLRKEDESLKEEVSGCSWVEEGVVINRLRPAKSTISYHSFRSVSSLFNTLFPFLAMASNKSKEIAFDTEPEETSRNPENQTLNILPMAVIENLSSSFASKISLPCKVAPLVGKSPFANKALAVAYKFSVVFKLVDVILAYHTVKAQIKKTWPNLDYNVPDQLTPEVFQVDFNKEEDFWKAVNQQPWILANHIMQVVPWVDYHRDGDAAFKTFLVWFQLPQLPPIFVREEVLDEMLADSRFYCPDQIKSYEFYSGNSPSEMFVRIKVVQDVEVPLPPGIRVPYKGKELWVPFAYEYLHMFCYRCGKVGHHQDGCVIPEALASELYSSKNRTLFSLPFNKKFGSLAKHLVIKLK